MIPETDDQNDTNKRIYFWTKDATKFGISKAIVLTTFISYMKSIHQSFTLCDDDRYWCVYDDMLKALKQEITALTSDYVGKLVVSLCKVGLIEARIVKPEGGKGKKLKICTVGRKYLDFHKGD